MAKKQEILIIDNDLYYELLDMYRPKDYGKEASIVRKINTEMAIREKIGSFVLEIGFYSRTHNRLEFEGKSQIVYLKQSSSGKKSVEYVKKQESKKEPDDPEARFRKKVSEHPYKVPVL